MPGYRWKRAGGGLDWIDLRSTTTFLDDDETMSLLFPGESSPPTKRTDHDPFTPPSSPHSKDMSVDIDNTLENP